MRKIIILLLTIFCLTACRSNWEVNEGYEVSEILLGVVDSSSTENNSHILWYDEDLNQIAKHQLKYASLGSPFSQVDYFDEEAFLIPQGLQGKQDAKLVISVNHKDYSITEYPMDNISLNDLAVNDSFIYTINTLNGTSHISSLNKETKEFKEILVEDEYVYAITATDDKVFCFSNREEISGTKIYLYVYDENLNLLFEKRLKNVGRGQMKFEEDKRYLYTASSTNDKDDGPGNQLLRIDKESYDVDQLVLEEVSPNDLYRKDNILYITHNDPVIGQGSSVSIVDLNSLTTKKFIDLEQDLELVAFDYPYFYSVSKDTLTKWNMAKDFSKEKEIEMGYYPRNYLTAIILWR